MTNRKLLHLVQSFLSDGPVSFNMDRFFAWTKVQGAELEYQTEFQRWSNVRLIISLPFYRKPTIKRVMT